MSDDDAVSAGTSSPRNGMELDETRLDAYLAAHIPGYRGPLKVRQFTGGQSNPTYLLVTPERRYVLRKKPPGQLLASAHAVDREYRVMSALGERTDVPVARTHLLCLDESVLGTTFYVMEYVAGRIFRDPSFPELAREGRRSYALAVCDSLARLHRVDPLRVGLGDYGKPVGYVARQISRWSKQYREDETAGRVKAMEQLIDWLPANVPATEEPAAIVHGDYRVDNVMFHPSEPRVLAVLDWELSSLGEARADLAYHLMVYRMPPLALPGLRGVDFVKLGLPTEREYIARYCEIAGRADVPDLEFYLAFCMFRLAGIFHGIRGRVARGNAVSPQAREYARFVEPIAELAWEQAQRASGG
jgi:aminoglycoside phosphotransferase (APT) family kinase protein